MSKQGVNLRRAAAYLLVLGFFSICGCKALKSVEKAPADINKNRVAIEGSTAAIKTNQIVVEKSTAAVATNAATLNKINAATDELKTNLPVVASVIALVALLLIVPSVLALLVLWRMNKLMKLWLRKNEIRK